MSVRRQRLAIGDGGYVRAESVSSPSAMWTLTEVIRHGSANDWAAAEGIWDGERRLALRWNGDRDRPRGNPLSSSWPTWFIVPTPLEQAVRAAVQRTNNEASAADDTR